MRARPFILFLWVSIGLRWTHDLWADDAPSGIVVTNIVGLDGLLTNTNAHAHPIVRVTGVVNFVVPSLRRLFLEDSNVGLQANLNEDAAQFRLGDKVEVTGQLEESVPHARLVKAEARLLASGNLPEPPFLNPHQLAAGKSPWRWVTTRGVVRDMVVDIDSIWLLLSHEGMTFRINIGSRPNRLPTEWLDAELEVSGISTPFFNARGRAYGFDLNVPSTDSVRLLSPGSGPLFDRPMMSISEAGALPQAWDPRYRISGVVLIQRPNGVLYMTDGTGIMLVIQLGLLSSGRDDLTLPHAIQTPPEPGERIEVIGARHNWYSLVPTMIFSEIRRVGRGPLPKPCPISISDLKAGRHAGELVTIKAQLLNHRVWGDGGGWHEILMLKKGGDVFQASWDSEKSAKWDLQLDSYVQVTGVFEAEGGQKSGRCTYQLLLRSPEDVVMTSAPPFWTEPGVQRVASGAGAVASVAAAWILVQRLHVRRLERRVAERTVALESEVAARLRAERELLSALANERELNQIKDSFVSMVSHEFRTPLEVILSSSNILDRYLDRLSPARRKNQLSAIRKAVGRMSDLIEEVLTIGKFNAGRMTCSPSPVDILDLCRRLVVEVETAASREGCIQLETTDQEGEAWADERLMEHILSNLLSNAVKFSPAGSKVKFDVARRGDSAEFSVEDRGVGIPYEDQGRLFTAFHRGNNVGQVSGSGLGLVIVKRCVDLHGGTIAFHSIPGQGTRFIVTLPLFSVSIRQILRPLLPTPTV